MHFGAVRLEIYHFVLAQFKNPVFQYYFNLYDNDMINGYKLSRSKTFQIDNVSNQNIKSSIKKTSENILNKLDETLELTSQLILNVPLQPVTICLIPS